VYLKADTLDDLLDKAFRLLLKRKKRVVASKGPTVEVQGIVLGLTNPRARLSRSHTKGHAFSGFGEFLWYLSARSELGPIRYYLRRYDDSAEDDGTIWGAYGPRMFGGEPSQYEIVRDLLKERETSRQAVIQLFDGEDIRQKYRNTPCTCTLQFLIRDRVLNMVVHMRSNDVYRGLPHDVFAFTMFQEILARDLGVSLGTYKHMVGSFHLYDTDREQVEQYLSEGLQPTREMPAMPFGPQWGDIKQVFKIEEMVRSGGPAVVPTVIASSASLQPYWADVVKLLAIYSLTKNFDGSADALRQVVGIRRSMSSQFYATYVRKKTRRLSEAVAQLDLKDQANTSRELAP
jgi:thymidylate synthase